MQNNKQALSNASYITAASSEDSIVMTDSLIEAICNNADLPTFGSSVSHLVKLSSSNNGSIKELSEFVLSDVSLTQRILRLSNSVNFRAFSGQEITSISKAIHLLGLETVKSCALAIILVDNMPGKKAQCVRHELALALTASVIGRELAKRIYFKDTEEVAIAALFKNIGRLLVAAYDEELYEDTMALVKMGLQTPAQASKLKLGYSFDMLTEIALEKWQIPDAIIQTIKLLSPRALTPPKTRQEWIRQAVVFSEAVAPLILETIEQDKKDQTNEALIAQFGRSLHLNETSLEQLINNAEKHAQALTENIALRPQADINNETYSDSSISNPYLIKKPAADEQVVKHDHISRSQFLGTYPSGKPFNAKKLLMAGHQAIAKLIATNDFNDQDLMTLFLQNIYFGLGFRFATVCLKNIQSNQFEAFLAMGEDYAIRQEAFFFSAVSSRNLFHLVLEKRVDLFISNASEEKIHKLIPAWHHSLLPDARSFIILPLIKNKKPIGLLYADRKVAAPEGIASDEKAIIKRLKDQIMVALH